MSKKITIDYDKYLAMQRRVEDLEKAVKKNLKYKVEVFRYGNWHMFSKFEHIEVESTFLANDIHLEKVMSATEIAVFNEINKYKDYLLCGFGGNPKSAPNAHDAVQMIILENKGLAEKIDSFKEKSLLERIYLAIKGDI